MNIRSLPPHEGSEVLEITGSEIIGELFATKAYIVQASMLINPQNPDLFPRSSALALPFDRFRFRRIGLTYHTASPATRSGSVGLVIMHDPLNAEPATMVALGGFENSSVSAISMSSHTEAVWAADTPWLLTGFGGLVNAFDPNATNLIDPTNRYPGKIVVVTSDAAVADNGLIGGYVTVEYTFELMRLKPVQQVLFSSWTNSLQPLGGSNIQPSLIPRESVGWWDWLNQNVLRPGSDFLQFARSIAVGPGRYSNSSNLFIEAPPSPSKVSNGPMTIRTWKNPMCHLPPGSRLAPPKPLRPISLASSAAACKSDSKVVVFQDDDVKISDEDYKNPLVPSAANDVLLELKRVAISNPIAAGAVSISSALINSATSFSFFFGDAFTVSEPSYLYLNLTTAGEVRNLQDSWISFSKAEDITS
jgi:hypothetical protein